MSERRETASAPPGASGAPSWARGAWARELAALGVLIAALGLLVWPALQDGRRGLGQFDASFTQLATEHLQDVLLSGASWRDAPLGWPVGYGTAHADWQAAQALLGLPLRLLEIDPSRAALLIGLAGLLATAWAGHRLAAALLGPGPHTWLAGVLLGFGTVAMSHLHHVNLIHHELMLLGALALGAGLQEDRPRWAGLGAAALMLGFHLGIYMGLHDLLAGASVAGAAAAARLGSGRSWRAAGLGAALAAITVWPVLDFYGDADAWLGASLREAEVRTGGWDLSTFFTANADAWLQERLLGPATTRFPGNPGFLALLLALVGLREARRLGPRWAWGAVLGFGLVSFALSLGPELRWRGESLGVPGPYALVAKLSGLSELREPKRLRLLVFMATGLLSAAGLKVLLARLPGWSRAPATLLTLGVALAETPAPGTVDLGRVFLPEAYQVIDQLPGEGALWERRQVIAGQSCACETGTMLRAALLHQRPLVGVSFARQCDAIDRLKARFEAWPSPSAAAVLEGAGVALVLEHPPVLEQTPPGWQCQIFGDHRLCASLQGAAWTGIGLAPPYTGLPLQSPWTPPLPRRDRDFGRYLPRGG